jgi:glycosyltransferase involved in cell wall biosynthesis
MKIGYVLRSLEDSGVTVYVLRLADEMRRQGHDVFLVGDGGIYEPEVQRLKLPRFPLPLCRDPVTSYLAARRLADLVRRQRPAILHANWRRAQMACHLAQKSTGTPFVSTLHTVGMPAGWLYQKMTHWGARVIAPCTEADVYLREVFAVPQEKIRLIPHGVDPAAWPVPGAEAKAGARKKFNLPPEAAVLVCVARLGKLKGQDLLIQALAGARSCGADLRLLLVGAGADESRLQALSRDLALTDAVQFLGFADPHEALAAADVFVLPSWQESFGLAPVEAMFAGRAPIRTDSQGAHDQIISGECGLIIPRGDLAALTAALTDVARDHDRWRERSQKAHDRAVQLFTLETMARRVTAVYEEVLAESAPDAKPHPGADR